MFARLGRFVVRRPWWVIAAWVVAAVVVVLTAPKLETSSQESDFLPKHYESIQAMQEQMKAFPDNATGVGAIMVVDRLDGKPLEKADTDKVTQIAAGLQREMPKPIQGVMATPDSPNHLVQTVMVGYQRGTNPGSPEAETAIKKLREEAKKSFAGTGLQAHTTGGTAQMIDNKESGGDAEKIIGLATIVLILLLMAVIFRSVILAILPIILILLISQIANGLIGFANKAFGLNADSSISVILIIVLFGIGTDYILFLMFRYRERLRLGEDPKTAMVSAVTRVGEAIASAAGAVIAAFAALVLSTLGMFRSMGPALAIAVGVTLIAGLTLVPAVVSLLGSKVFWPSKSWRTEPKAARFAAIGASMGRRPVAYAVVSGLVLVAMSVLAFGFHPTFDFGSSSMPKTAESSMATETLKKGMPAGATDPTTVILSGNSKISDQQAAQFAGKLKVNGVGNVSPPQYNGDHTAAIFRVSLTDAPTSEAALDAVKGPIRDAAHAAAPPGSKAYVGGTTSVFVDLHEAMIRDYTVVFPVAAGIIMLILALLLRSVVAPLYLMASVGLGFGATLGTTVLLFQTVGGKPGLIFMLPIYMYLFVVALGTDYNILMVARLREEAKEGLSPRDAAAQAVRHAGPTIAAAGVILAGSFAALMLAGNDMMTSMGFAIAFGIGVAAFVMAMFFVPALTALIGHAAWWPGHGDRADAPPPREQEREPVAVG